MKAIGLQCAVCGQIYPLEDRYECQACGDLLQVIYEKSAGGAAPAEELTDDAFSGLWRYHRMLPLENTEHIVSLGEGNMPLVRAGRIYSGPSMDNFYIKSKFSNPTASFKDRPTSVGISVAKEYGATTVAVASSGNAGISVATYATKAGMRCLACVPQKTSPGKVGQLMVCGVTVTFVSGGYSDCFKIVRGACKHYGYVNLTPTYVNPYTAGGDKAVAYELSEQMKGEVPDWITVPIGTGPLLSGVYRGYQELMAMDLVSRLPHILGVQVETYSPIVKEFEKEGGRVEACTDMGDTIAGGIVDQLIGYEGDGEYTIHPVRESGGRMTSLTEEEIREAQSELSRTEGVFAEPTGATAAGDVKKVLEQDVIKPTDTVIAFVTGRGLKAAHYCIPGAGEGGSFGGNAEVRPIRVITRPEEPV